MKYKSLLGPWIRRFLLESGRRAESFPQHPNQLPRYADIVAAVCQQAGRLRHRSHERGRADAGSRPQVPGPPGARSPLQRSNPQQRLATIHSLARFIGRRSPVHLAWCSEIRAVPFKKTAKTQVPRRGGARLTFWAAV